MWSFRPYASPLLTELHQLPYPHTERPTFAWIGAFNQQKSPEIFVRALASLSSTGVRGVMAGTGPRSDEIAQLIASTRAPVEMVGQLDDITGLLSETTAVALFSRFEAVPFALQEAMWAGRQVVATPHSGIRWLCGDDGRYAATVDESASHLRALTDRDVAEREGRRAAVRVRHLLAPAGQWIEIEQAFLSEFAGVASEGRF
jgi:glycosyltransferase involved in cell wall biosynthesis